MSSNVEDVEMQDVENDSDEEDDIENDLGRSSVGPHWRVADCLSDKSEDEEEPEPEHKLEEDEMPPPLAKGERNSQLTVGYKGDRSYVIRGNKIGVFRHTGDNEVKYHASISNIATPKGKEFNPKHVWILRAFK